MFEKSTFKTSLKKTSQIYNVATVFSKDGCGGECKDFATIINTTNI